MSDAGVFVKGGSDPNLLDPASYKYDVTSMEIGCIDQKFLFDTRTALGRQDSYLFNYPIRQQLWTCAFCLLS